MFKSGSTHGRKRAAWVACLFIYLLLSPLPCRAEKGAMQIGLASYYAAPRFDLEGQDPAVSYGIMFHYWLNDTTSVELGFEYLNFPGPMEVDGEDEGINWVSQVLGVGLRYRPELDFFLDPYAELMFGYQFWNTVPGDEIIDSRNGGSVAYLAGAGLEYNFRHNLVLSMGARFRYLPMREDIEREVRTIAPETYSVEEDELFDVGFLTGGIELVWRFR